jgi:hypothetical protein
LLELGVVGVADANNIDPEILESSPASVARHVRHVSGDAAAALRRLAHHLHAHRQPAGPHDRAERLHDHRPRPLWISRAGIIPVGDTIDLKLHQATRQEWFNESLKI